MRTICLSIVIVSAATVTGCATRARYTLRDGEYTKLSNSHHAVVSHGSTPEGDRTVESVTFDVVEHHPASTGDGGATDVSLWARDQRVTACSSTLVGVGVPLAGLAGGVIGSIAASSRGEDAFGAGMTGFLGLLGSAVAAGVILPLASHAVCGAEHEDVVVVHPGPPR